MFSFCTRMPSGTRSTVGAKFQIARTPASTSLSQTSWRVGRGHGDDADVQLQPLGDVGHLLRREYRDAVEGGVPQRRVAVERGDDLQPVLLEAHIGHQRLAEMSGAHDHRAVDVVISQKAFDIGLQLADAVADLRLAAAADEREVLAHLHLIEPERVGDRRRGNIRLVAALLLAQITEIQRQPRQRFLDMGSPVNRFSSLSYFTPLSYHIQEEKSKYKKVISI